MTADNMRSVVTFTFFSFLLLTIAMFLVFYRYDLYNMDTATFIRIGFIVGDASNETKKDKVADVKYPPHIEDILDNQNRYPQNTESGFVQQEGSGQPSAHNNPFYENFLAILATRAHRPVEIDGQKSPSGVEITTRNPLVDDSIRRMISKLEKSRDAAIAPERKSVAPITLPTIESIPDRSTLIDREAIIAGKSPSTPRRPKLNGGSSSRGPQIKEYEPNRHVVSYPAERLPSPMPAASPQSWPSLFLPDSGFAESSEISPFSLFSRFADILDSNEDEKVQPLYDSQGMWPRFDDITDFFISPRKRVLQGYSSEELDPEEDSDSYDNYDETKYSDEPESPLNQDFDHLFTGTDW